MSGKAVGWAMEQRTGSPTTKLVLVKLADNANEWEAWPSIRVICEDTELGESTVRMHLRKLEALGLITGSERFAEGVQLTTRYTLNAQGWVPRHEVKKAEKVSRRKGPPAGPQVQHVEAVGQALDETGPGRGPGPRHDVAPNPYTEPLVEPLLSKTPAGAGESEIVASLGEGQAERWPEFRSAVANAWPDGFPAKDEVACRTQFERLTRQHSTDLLVACAGLHGAELRRLQQSRGGKSKEIAKRPSNWLREREWEGYIPQAQAAVRREAEIVTALGNVRRAVGEGIFELLKRQGMQDATIALLDGMSLAAPARFAITRPFQRTLLEKHEAALERHLRERPSFTLVAEAKAS